MNDAPPNARTQHLDRIQYKYLVRGRLYFGLHRL